MLCVDVHRLRGATGNFRESLKRLITQSQQGDWLLTLEDDIQVAVGLYDWLLAELNTLEHRFGPIGVASVYTAASVSKKQTGWNAMSANSRCLGACAIAMPHDAAAHYLCFSSRKAHPGDSLLEWCYATGRHWLFHSPSYVQHIGVQSSLHDFGITPDREANDFVQHV